ncbi:MAG: CAP domain-containing protein [Acidobacteriota bacterium]
MRRLRFGAAWLVLAGVGTGVWAQRAAPAGVAEQYLFQAANAEREQRGLPMLRWDDALYHAAERHAHEMAARRSISHQYEGEAGLGDRARVAGARFSMVAENVAEAPSAVRIHDAWMQSPGHRANLLDGRANSVGISVLERDGQLYAVEDFDRSVAPLSIVQQEGIVAALVEEAGPVNVLPADEDAKRTCAMETGYAGSRQPYFVMRYTASDLSRLPEVLKGKLASGRFHDAMVAACPARGTESFSAFSIVVMLYP